MHALAVRNGKSSNIINLTEIESCPKLLLLPLVYSFFGSSSLRSAVYSPGCVNFKCEHVFIVLPLYFTCLGQSLHWTN